MQKLPVIGIFDIGKTNKKLLLFDEQLHIVKEQSCRIPKEWMRTVFPQMIFSPLRTWQ